MFGNPYNVMQVASNANIHCKSITLSYILTIQISACYNQYSCQCQYIKHTGFFLESDLPLKNSTRYYTLPIAIMTRNAYVILVINETNKHTIFKTRIMKCITVAIAKQNQNIDCFIFITKHGSYKPKCIHAQHKPKCVNSKGSAINITLTYPTN